MQKLHRSDQFLRKKEKKKVGILNRFSKIYKKHFLEKCISFMNGFIPQFISAYRENYMSFLIRLIENWKESLDKGFATDVL